MFDFGIIPTAEASIITLMKSVDRVIINPIIFFMFACAMAYFLYGLAQYLLSPGNEEVHKKSKSIMLWGVIGLFIMTAVFGIMKIILNTVGENKIKINSNGDYVVDGGDVADRTIADNPKSGLDFNGVTDVKDISQVSGTPDLPMETFTTSPFATYKADPLCWNDVFPGSSATEFNATDQAKTKARNAYLKATGVLANDKSKLSYPVIFSSKVLYNKKTSTYYTWLDVRAPIKTGTMANCALKVITPPKSIPQAAVFDSKDISSTAENPDLPDDFYVTTPFATFVKNDLCWNYAAPGDANTEYDALDKARTLAKTQFLKFIKDNNIPTTDEAKANYPVTFETQTLYKNSIGRYYVWLDVRAPIRTGTMASCALKVQTGARVPPESTLFTKVVATTDEINLSDTVVKNRIKDFTKSPFIQQYQPNPVCWRKELYAKATTEFAATSLVKVMARMQYISENNLDENKISINLPIPYGILSAYDKVTKNYYVWWDARAPIKSGKIADCNLLPIGGSASGIPILGPQSAKKNPFTIDYVSDKDFYRVVESGVDPDYTKARNTAITNALIQIAHLAGVKTLDEITDKTILQEKYYQKDINTGNYDYWVAMESPV